MRRRMEKMRRFFFYSKNEKLKSPSVIDLFDMLNQLGASTSKLRSGLIHKDQVRPDDDWDISSVR